MSSSNEAQPAASDDVLVCRCEEVRLSHLLVALERGFAAPETLKRATRVSMGACQGRVCRPIYRAFWRARDASTAAERASPSVDGHIGTRGDSRASLPVSRDLDLPGSRPPVRPIRVGDLADLEPPDEAPTPSQGNR